VTKSDHPHLARIRIDREQHEIVARQRAPDLVRLVVILRRTALPLSSPSTTSQICSNHRLAFSGAWQSMAMYRACARINSSAESVISTTYFIPD
jgi:hypothetical protein